MKREIGKLGAQAVCAVPLYSVLLGATPDGWWLQFCCGFVSWAIAGTWIDSWQRRSNA